MPMYTEDDLQELLEKNFKLTQENNRLLRKLRRAQVWAAIFKVVWLVVLIGVPIWFYLSYVAPYLEGMLESYNQMQEQVEGLSEIKNTLPSKEDLPEWAQGFFGGSEATQATTASTTEN